jgi:hypothetical protein
VAPKSKYAGKSARRIQRESEQLLRFDWLSPQLLPPPFQTNQPNPDRRQRLKFVDAYIVINIVVNSVIYLSSLSLEEPQFSDRERRPQLEDSCKTILSFFFL